VVDNRYLIGIAFKWENQMPLPHTETSNRHEALDLLDADASVQLMLRAQIEAIESVRSSADQLLAGARVMAQTIEGGGRLIYAAAGSSGLMALADSSELTGTFGIPSEQIQIHMAGGVPIDAKMPGNIEDETADIDISARDVIIVLSASGTTPYALASAGQAKKAGARIIAISNNGGAPLLRVADVAIQLNTPAEVVAGSTRLGAGTAQKVALNVMSTIMGVQLGHVYQGLMVNLIADNEKLRGRAEHIVCKIASVAPPLARSAIEQANGQVKLAILIAAGNSHSDAQSILTKNKGHLGPCLNSNQTT
jgi:N-acetylmuramic acid 6-phosphate etherase